MKVITRDEKDAYDIITHNLCYLESERMNLLVSLLIMKNSLKEIANEFPAADNYIDSLGSFVKNLLDENHKEAQVYEKMLRYLQLMITNDTYEYYTDSYFFDLFNKLIKVLENNKSCRESKMTILLTSIAVGVRNRAESITIKTNYDIDKPLISDEAFEDMLQRIPKR